MRAEGDISCGSGSHNLQNGRDPEARVRAADATQWHARLGWGGRGREREARGRFAWEADTLPAELLPLGRTRL